MLKQAQIMRKEARDGKDILLADRLRTKLGDIEVTLKDNSDETCVIEFTNYA